jgi:addiction module RelE/StbE family toxin
MAKEYELIFDDFSKFDLKAIHKAPKKIKADIETALHRLRTNPKCFKQLSGALSGFRKAKTKGNYRIVYSVEDNPPQVLILVIGERATVYDTAMSRLEN